LARFCQALIESLFEYLDQPRGAGLADSLKQQLDEAAQSLDQVIQGDLYQFGKRKAAAFSTYSEVRTLVEVLGPEAEIKKAVALIRSTLKGGSGQRVRARQLIDLFSKLRAKALWDFQQTVAPEDPIESRELSAAH
jgi:hypothetical protein